jgi:hypothetical protein
VKEISMDPLLFTEIGPSKWQLPHVYGTKNSCVKEEVTKTKVGLRLLMKK